MSDVRNVREEDAYARVVQAKIGSGVNATDTFLVALRRYLYEWIAAIDAELARRDHERRQRLEDEEAA